MSVDRGSFFEEIKLKLEHIEVPVLFKYAFGSGNLKPYLVAGPTVGFNLTAKQGDDDIKDTTKSIDFGLGLGAGVTMPAGSNAFFVEARYALGLMNVSDNPPDQEIDVKTRGVQIFAGITFPLGGK